VGLSGTTAFFSIGGAVASADVSTPAAPVLLGRVEAGDPIWGIQVAGNLAFATDRWDNVFVLDVTDPMAMEVVGTYQTTGSLQQPTEVAVSGSYAFAAIRGVGLHILDISDPTNPTLAATFTVPGVNFVFDVVIDGDYAYVAADAQGVRVVDISNPLVPVEVGSFPAATQARGLAVVGQNLHVADGSNGYRLLDVSTPATPTQVGSFSAGWNVSHVAVAGTKAYLSELVNGLRVLDISNPVIPMDVGLLSGNAFDLEVMGDTVFVTDTSDVAQSSLRIVDTSTPATPTEVAVLDFAHFSKGLTASGSFVLVGNGVYGLAVLKHDGPNGPKRVGSLSLPGDSRDVVFDGATYAYVAARGSGVHVVDVSTPSAPTLATSIPVPGSIAYDVHLDLAQQLLFVGNGGSGMRVLDVSTPTSPTEIGFFDPASGAVTFIAAEGSLAVAVGGSEGWVLDISNPMAPVEVGSFSLPFTALEVVIDNGLLYIADGVGGLLIWSLADPTNPAQIGEFSPFPLAANGVAVSGDRAYVAGDTYYGLLVVDISDPTNPVQVGSYDTPGSGERIAVTNDRIFIADYDAGVTVLGCPEELFVDGFDSGDTTAWDATVP